MVLLVCCFGLSLWAQRAVEQEKADRARRIKLSDDEYWWDEDSELLSVIKRNPGRIEDMKIKTNAMLGTRIQSFVQTAIEHRESEQDGVASSGISRQINISSRLYLKNLEYLTYERDKKLFVLAYLKREDFRKQEQDMITQISRVKALAQQMEETNESRYLYFYYKAYLMCFNITKSFVDIETGENMQLWLEKKLYDILKKIELQCNVSVSTDLKHYDLELKLNSNALPTGLLVDITDMDFRRLPITENKCSFYYEGQPSRKREDKRIILSINPEIVSNDIEINEIAKSRRIEAERLVTLDFSKIITVDFDFEVQGFTVRILPIHKNISIASMLWDMGDGSVKEEYNSFEHLYRRDGGYTVKMLVNGEIGISKKLVIDPPPKPVVVPEVSIQAEIVDSVMVETEIALPPEEVVVLPENEVVTQPSHVQELKKLANFKETEAYLNNQKKMGNLAWGRITRNTDIRNSWIMVFEKDESVCAILYPRDGVHYEVFSEILVDQVIDTYRGKAFVYISYYEED